MLLLLLLMSKLLLLPCLSNICYILLLLIYTHGGDARTKEDCGNTMFLSEFLRILFLLCKCLFVYVWERDFSPGISNFSILFRFFLCFFFFPFLLFVYFFFVLFEAHFFRCPSLLSSSFRLFICLLPGCLFRLSNDKCVLRANIGKNRMWFELDGSLALLLLLLLSHIMPNPLVFPFLFVLFLFSPSPIHSLTHLFWVSIFQSSSFFSCNVVCSTYVFFLCLRQAFLGLLLRLDKEIRTTFSNSTKKHSDLLAG